jgi:cytochrome c-type biogenesis protein CcmH/NrfG
MVGVTHQGSVPGSRFEQTMQAGRKAFNAGKKREAHDLWHEAARLDPFREEVWLALLDVVASDEDRHVCLQNIIAINPLNVRARRLLRAQDAKEQKANQRNQRKVDQARQRSKGRRDAFSRALVRGIALGVMAVVLAVFISIVLYGR